MDDRESHRDKPTSEELTRVRYEAIRGVNGQLFGAEEYDQTQPTFEATVTPEQMSKIFNGIVVTLESKGILETEIIVTPNDIAELVDDAMGMLKKRGLIKEE